MRISILYLLLFFGCQNSQPTEVNPSLNSLKPELSGELLGEKTLYFSKKIKDAHNDISIYAAHSDSILNELDIHFKTKASERFIEIQNYYNALFLKSEKDTVYSSWLTDSTEFILYKNSDSSILVNIFKRN